MVAEAQLTGTDRVARRKHFRALGCGAHLGGLVRTRSGPFLLEESITLADLEAASAEGTLASYLQPADRALAQYPALHLTADEAVRVKHGNPFAYALEDGIYTLGRVYDAEGEFIAIAEWRPEVSKWQPKKVFGE